MEQQDIKYMILSSSVNRNYFVVAKESEHGKNTNYLYKYYLDIIILLLILHMDNYIQY